MGFAVVLHCVWNFAWTGQGTITAFAPPTHLVVRRFYRFVRNPMYLGFAAGWLGLWILFGHASLSLVAIVALGASAVYMLVVLYEEPNLRRKFGAEYNEYCRNVRRWWSRIRAWNSMYPAEAEKSCRFEVILTNGRICLRKFGSLAICGGVITSVVLGIALHGQEKQEKNGSVHQIVRPSDLKWSTIMKGCELALISGDPNAEGSPFVMRIHCADGTKIPAHWHPTDENLTILKGTFLLGMGETFDESKLQPMSVGSFIKVPREMKHFAKCKGEHIAQIHGVGPFKVNWVNPAEVLPGETDAKKKR